LWVYCYALKWKLGSGRASWEKMMLKTWKPEEMRRALCEKLEMRSSFSCSGRRFQFGVDRHSAVATHD